MNELQVALQIAMANTFIMYYKSHQYHWNVEGLYFSQYHEFFGDLYAELQSAIDSTAEQLRAIDGYAPVSLVEILRYATIDEDMGITPLIRSMLGNLMVANSETMNSLNKVCELAEQQGNQGLLNFAAGRLDVHSKHAWMLKSSIKNIG